MPVPLIALVLVVLGLDEAGASVTARSVAALLVWWTALTALAFSVAPRARLPRAALACVALLLGFALLAGLSTGWAPSAERAFEELDRVLLYAGVLLLAVILTRAGDAGRWADGLAAGVAIVTALALGQRLLPGLFPGYDLAGALPEAGRRLSYPLGYWNGVGIFAGLAVPLLLRVALAARAWPWRALAVAALPVAAATIYLTSSRGGVAVAVVAAVAFVLLCGEGVRAAVALVIGGAGSALAVAVIHARPVLVDGPFGSSAATSAGSEAAALVALVCVAAGLVHALIARLLPGKLALPRAARAAVAVLSVAAVAIALVAVDIAERFRTFKAAPTGDAAGPTAIGAHLSSGGGSGRWQFWGAALDQFKEHPLAGGGAASFEPWWAQHGSIDWFVRNAHSLWLETLGELGLLGLLLLGGAFAVALVTGLRRLGGRSQAERTTVAALLALVAAFAFGAAIDWVWQLPVVAIVALVAMGLLVGPATQPDPYGAGTAPVAAEVERPRRGGIGARVAVALLAWVAICLQAIPFLASRELAASRQAARSGDTGESLERARSAQAIEPWAATPRLQQALAHERAGRIDLARRQIEAAIERDSGDWRLQVVATRLAVKDRDIAAARRSFRRARALNPRSPLLRDSRRVGGTP